MFRSLVALAAVFIFVGLPDIADAQSSRRITVVLTTINEGLLGDANRTAAAGAELFGSYQAYVDGQDVGRVPYGKLSSFMINSRANSFTLWEHQPFEKKSVSNTVNINGIGRSSTFGFESVQNIFVFCANTQTINFNCEAISESDFRNLARGY